MFIISQWRQLRDLVEKIEQEIAYTHFPIPTTQMCKFLIVGEDHRFYYHPGVDALAICRAIWKNVFCGARQGASTIAMQLVRTITGRYERTWRRKLIEIFLAVLLSQHVSKEQLPILYLWVAYYGWEMNNFRQACSRLEINPRSSSAFEAAKLVARLKYPESKNYDIKCSRKIQHRALYLMTLANRLNNRL